MAALILFFLWVPALVIKSFFSSSMTPSADQSSVGGSSDIRLAACALLLELAYADDEFSEEEQQHLESAVRRQFGLEEAEAVKLLELAQREREEACRRFLRVLKWAIVRFLWCMGLD